MTTSQQARIEGALLTLDVRGVSLVVDRTGSEVKAVIRRSQPGGDEFRVGNGEAVSDVLHLLRGDVPGQTQLTYETADSVVLTADLQPLALKIGDVFRDPVARYSYRVVAVEDSPADIWVAFTCETSRDQ